MGRNFRPLEVFGITVLIQLKANTAFMCSYKCPLSCASPYNVIYVLTESGADIIVVIMLWSFIKAYVPLWY